MTSMKFLGAVSALAALEGLDHRGMEQDELRRICDDPVAARDFLLHSSMIKTLERAASLD